VLGELARGGVGVVLKIRDGDLGRDVAMKVLREEYAGREDLVERFVEEAQIGGQLQHPGIVPVYEMGLQDGRNPFFTMKLVKGRTLAALLSERRSPSDDRRRLLGVFEAVCQTLAYAHARGVVHRDLKPSNVMVGAFGEVHLVDWGLAKVMSQGGVEDERRAKRAAAPHQTVIATVRSGSPGSVSLVGSILGTPAYMPPEQARGEVSLLDERSDVFALGAILCEILTGKPPYAGTDEEVVAFAARADLSGARERLAASGTAPDLATLCEACLSPAPAARPKDAGEVDREVSACLARAEERARDAVLRAAGERARAVDAAKARRVTTAIAATAALAVLAGGIGTFAVLRARSARSAGLHRQIAAAMDEASVLRGRAASGGGAAAWAEALVPARRAGSLAGSPDADDASREAAGRLLREIEDGDRSARAGEERRGRDDRMRAALDDLRLQAWDLDPKALEKRYGDAFRTFGVDPDGGSLDEAAKACSTSSLVSRLAATLDAWALARRRAGLSPAPVRKLADLLDDDPWRRRLRTAESPADLRALAASADAEALPLESLSALAGALAAAGDLEGAVQVSSRVVERFPGDPWMLSQHAFWLVALPVPRRAEAHRFAEAARDLQPGSSGVWANLGWVIMSWASRKQSEPFVRRALEIHPGNALAHTYLGRLLRGEGKLDEAVEEFRRAMVLQPDLADARSQLGFALWLKGQRKEAVEAMREAVALEPKSPRAHSQLARLLVEVGEFRDAMAEFRAAIALDPRSAEAHMELGNLHYALTDFEASAEESREAVRLSPGSANVLLTLGGRLGTLGSWEESLDACQGALRLGAPASMTWQSIAGCCMALGDFERAIDASDAAEYSQAGRSGISRLPALLLARRYDEAQNLIRVELASAGGAGAASWRQYLGQTLQMKGQFTQAVAEFARAAALDPSPARKGNLADARRLASLEARLPAVRRGEDRPGPVPEILDFARMCGMVDDDAAAVRLFEKAFAASPETGADPVSDIRLAAISNAGSAGAGTSPISRALEDGERARLRGLALQWLRADLKTLRERFERDPDGVRSAVLSWYISIRGGQPFFPVRRNRSLEGFPPAERDAWRAFWEEAAGLFRDARLLFRDVALAGRGSLPRLTAWLRGPAPPDGFSFVTLAISRLKDRAGSPLQATGEPDTPDAGHPNTAWNPANPDMGEQWLELVYPEAVLPEAVRIREVAGAGAVTRVAAQAPDGSWSVLWEGPPTGFPGPRWFEPPLRKDGPRTRRIRLTLDTTAVPGWNTIDAVELVGEGKRQWASDASASSFYSGFLEIK
jgi:serine/threonine-protein kinase